MRVLALQLLAICQLASASPCKPSSSSGSVALSTSSVESTSGPVVSSSTIAGETETSTTFFTESTAMTETETAATETETENISGSTTALASDSDISTILITTSNTEPTTLATSNAEPTTTSTSAAEPTNVLINPGFELRSIVPWHPVGQFGSVSLSDENIHSGEFCGYHSADLNDPVVLGVDHPIDQSLIQAGKEYTYSIWIKTIQAVNCQTRKITCGAGGGYIKSQDWAGSYNEWMQFTMSCTWNELFLGFGPSIQVRAECQSLEIYVDDAILIEAN